MKATQLLKSQHRAAAKIFGELEKGRAANAQARVQELVASLSAHMVIEQELFYPAVKEIKPDLVLESFEERLRVVRSSFNHWSRPWASSR